MLQPSKVFGRLGNSLFQYAYIYANMRRGKIPDVYVQNPAYFHEYREELKKLFQITEWDNQTEDVAVHVRRGDYVNNPFYVDLHKDGYYKRAMALFPDKKFTIFTDDVDWCMKQEEFKNCAVDLSDEINALEHMASHKYIIIANSSFSWWGAYLSNAEKIVAPVKWYTDGQERTKCPSDWIRV